MEWGNAVLQLRQLATDADVFGDDPFHLLEVLGMALERTHEGMSKDDEHFVQNVLGHYRERIVASSAAAAPMRDGREEG